MKILWIDLNSSYAHSSLALPALHAQIANDPSIEWAIVSATINENVGTVVDEAYRHKPDIIAATTWLFNHEQLLHITSRLKVLLPEACLILGGPEFLGNNELFLRKYPFVDCVFRGEGEEVFPQWLTCRNQPELWNDITGLCYLDTDKQYRDNGTARVLNFSRLIPPEKAVSSIGTNRLCNLKPHADVSTHAPFASAAAKNLYVHSPLKTSANGFKPFTNTVSKHTCTRPYIQLQYASRKRTASAVFRISRYTFSFRDTSSSSF